MPDKHSRSWKRWAVALVCVSALIGPPAALAQEPDPGIAPPAAGDPELETRVRTLSYKLRCLVCQNESLAESRAPLAVDLRNQVREQLAAGKSEDEVVDFLVARYGDFVLYRPPFRASTVLLWLGPALLLAIALTSLIVRVRRRQTTAHDDATATLTPEEQARAQALLEGRTEDTPEEPRS